MLLAGQTLQLSGRRKTENMNLPYYMTLDTDRPSRGRAMHLSRRSGSRYVDIWIWRFGPIVGNRSVTRPNGQQRVRCWLPVNRPQFRFEVSRAAAAVALDGCLGYLATHENLGAGLLECRHSFAYPPRLADTYGPLSGSSLLPSDAYRSF